MTAPLKTHIAKGDVITLCGRRLDAVTLTLSLDETLCNQCRTAVGLAKLSRGPRALNPRPSSQPDPEVGQIWEDIQARSEGRKRRLCIIQVEDNYVHFFSLEDIVRKCTRKALRARFTGDHRGYRYVGENE